MRIKSIKLENIRCFPALDLNLDRQVTLLYGVNGVGKSTIVDSLAKLLTVIPGIGASERIHDKDLRFETRGAGGSFSREQHPSGSISVVAELRGKSHRWSLSLERGEEPKLDGGASKLKEQIQSAVSKGDGPLPLVAVYPVDRRWRDLAHAPLFRVSRLEGYSGALEGGTDLADLRAWWQHQDHRRQRDERTPALDAAEVAVARFLGDPKKLPTYSLDEEDITVELPFNGARVTLRELSDGYRSMVGMVADIARRMAQLNPHAGEELLRSTPGVVVVDELDLHLHPRWQRHILPQLRETFPALQWILTTHSPQVIASVESGHEIVGLAENGKVIYGGHAVGLDSNSVLKALMGAEIRPPDYERKLSKLFSHIDLGELSLAYAILEELEQKWGEDEPNLTRARWLIEAEEPIDEDDSEE